MGAWAAAIFGNDTACDWAYGLENCADLSMIEESLNKILAAGNNYLDETDAEEALAAAEIVARLQGHPGENNNYTEEIDIWVSKFKGKLKITPALARKTIWVIDRILTEPSHLLDAWQESEQFEEWRNIVLDLKSRIELG